MSNFTETLWTNNQFIKEFRDDAGVYLPFRSTFFEIANSYIQFFFEAEKSVRMLDLGCGDGLFVQQLFQNFNHIEIVTMVDGSENMLCAAKQRLRGHNNITYLNSSFQELLENDQISQKYDLIFSSLAIHHLNLEEKSCLYKYIFDHLNIDGHFLHYDIVIASNCRAEKWSMSLWKKWIAAHIDNDHLAKLIDIPDQYKKNIDNIPDTLDAQLNALKAIGFKNVDCFFKYGAFSLFGGSK